MKNDQINSMINSLEYAVIKARWYRDSGDISYLKECGDWIEVSRLYMRHINPNTNNDIDNLLGSLEIQ